jgi:hypothetical protein
MIPIAYPITGLMPPENPSLLIYKVIIFALYVFLNRFMKIAFELGKIIENGH